MVALSSKSLEDEVAALDVLVIDDDELSGELLTLLLGAEGHQIELAASGEEGLAMLERSTPDAVLTDIQMPGICGDVLGEALRAVMPQKAVLLAMSGSWPEEKTFESYDGFLLKPFSVNELQAKIEQVKASGANLSGHTIIDLVEHATEDDGNVSQAAALNEDVYAKLSETMPAAQLGQMFSMCLEDARSRIERMSVLAAAGDDVKYRAAAHAIKGGSGFIGATELYLLAEKAEREGLGFESGTTVGKARAEMTLRELSSACERLERILDKRTRV